MAIKLKFSESASAEAVAEVLGLLSRSGFRARRLFPTQQRPSLATIYAIEGTDAPLPEVRRVLRDHIARRDIEFIEGSPDRRPLTG